MKKISLVLTLVLLVAAAFANKTSVKIAVPDKVQKGQPTTITIQVTHNGNSKMHHTNWVTLTINGKEVNRWEYSGSHLPANEDFTVTYQITPTEDMEIKAQGNCNLHGSTGADTKLVKVE